MNIKLENLGSLITIAGTNTCLGHLMDFHERGVYDAEHGKVEVTPEQAKIHNECLDKAMLDGLDNQCQIGQCGTYYFTNGKVTTFCGTLVSDKVQLTPSKKGITFLRNGKQYRGRLQKDADCFNFKRIS